MKNIAVQFLSTAIQEMRINLPENETINPKMKIQYEEWLQRMIFESTTDKPPDIPLGYIPPESNGSTPPLETLPVTPVFTPPVNSISEVMFMYIDT
jgi:hypothetical protein